MRLTKEYVASLQSFETEEAYRASSSLNYSMLKNIPDGPECLIRDIGTYAPNAFAIGNYVDRYFTDRESIDEIYELSKPIIELPESLETLYQILKNNEEFEPSLDKCVTCCRENSLWSSIKDDEKLKSRFTEQFFEKLKQSETKSNKIQLTVDQYAQALAAIENIERNDDAINLITSTDDQIVFPQFKYEFDMLVPSGRMYRFRIMLDLLILNWTMQKISAVDIKTGTNESHKFGDQFKKYRYDIQGILYYFGLLALRKQYFPEWNKCAPEDFKFLYSPKKANKKPIIIKLSEEFIRSNGDSFCGQDGIFKILDDVDWYLYGQTFDTHRLIDNSNGGVDIIKLI